MERARILRWRLEQQTARLQQLEQDAQSHHAARQVRPLFELYLPTLTSRLGATSVHHETAIPCTKVEGDRRSVLSFVPVRDPLTTKVFSLPPLLGSFVLGIRANSMTLDFITTLYRHRGKYEGDVDSGQWLPPGDYLEIKPIACTEWQDDEQIPLVFQQFTADVDKQIPVIQTQMAEAERNMRRRYWWMGSERALTGLAIALAIGLMIFLLVWCVTSFTILSKQGFPLFPN